jgi:hypothetical protein
MNVEDIGLDSAGSEGKVEFPNMEDRSGLLELVTIDDKGRVPEAPMAEEELPAEKSG